ncbi:MAG: alpha/beta hydrolase [Woeseiaceae bacterium]|nr:alpha/beta hydrolase [Woeseiaceae bacterium]
MQPEENRLKAAAGHEIRVLTWHPESQPTAVIQVLHGLGEHAGRYARFAKAAAARGFALGAHDHRGHGPGSPHPGHFADEGGWQHVVDDAGIVNEALRETFPGLPVVMLGHSMGSYLAQHFAMHSGALLAGLLLSASTWPRRGELALLGVVARVEAWRHGPRGMSALLHRLGFDNFNRRFEPARTALDWLSRDPDEVDRYLADPLCGGPYTTRLWRDLLEGLMPLGSNRSLERIPADLPILITGGTDDPVGGERALTRLATHYAQTGHGRLKVRIYEGGRHEMLNEINRDEVTADWLDWIAATTRSARAG